MLINELANNNEHKQNLFFTSLSMVYLLLGFVVFSDFISLGGIKKIKDKNISKVYLWIYRFYSTITLSFLYRPLIYNFTDHQYTRKLFFFSIPYFLIIIFAQKIFSSELYPHYPKSELSLEHGFEIKDCYYADKRKERYHDDTAKPLCSVLLEKLVMKKGFNSLFIKASKNDYKFLNQVDSLSPFLKRGFRVSMFSRDETSDPVFQVLREKYNKDLSLLRDEKKQIKKEHIASKSDKLSRRRLVLDTLIANKKLDRSRTYDFYHKRRLEKSLKTIKSLSDVQIDGKDWNDQLNCKFYEHPNANERGLLCFFNSSSLNTGPHEMVVKKKYYDEKMKDQTNYYTYNIPFYITE